MPQAGRAVILRAPRSPPTCSARLKAVPSSRQLPLTHAASVRARAGQNPSNFSLQGTNTYLVGRGDKKILIDSGQGEPAYLDTLAEAMDRCGCTGIEQIVITHWHHDHLGGVPSVQERFGPNIPVRKFMPEQAEATTGTGEGAIDPYSIWPRDEFGALQDGEVVMTEGASLKAIYTPGHANDHLAFVLEEEGSMFTADNVLGIGTAVFSDLGLYIDSLERMQSACAALDHDVTEENSKPVRLYTGHGPMIEDGVHALGEYVEHRMARVRQVSDLLTGGGGGRSWTVEEVTRAIYAGPDGKLTIPERLVGPAMSVTSLVLKKLRDDGTAAADGEGEGEGEAAVVRWTPKL